MSSQAECADISPNAAVDPRIDARAGLPEGTLGRAVSSVLAADPGARAVYLFGSRARGDWDEDSDVDLLVVTDRDDFRTLGDIRLALLWMGMDKDVLTCTPEYFDSHVDRFGNFLNGVREDLVRLYG